MASPSSNTSNPFAAPFPSSSTATIVEGKPITIKEKSPIERCTKIALVILGICLTSLVVGLIVLYFPTFAHVFFTILGATAAISITYLIVKAIKDCRQRALEQRPRSTLDLS